MRGQAKAWYLTKGLSSSRSPFWDEIRVFCTRILVQEHAWLNPAMVIPNYSGRQLSQPSVTDSQPTVTDSQPTVTDSQPTDTDSQPTDTDSQPTDTDSQPTDTDSQPTDTDSQPTDTDSQPTDTDSQPTDSYHNLPTPIATYRHLLQPTFDNY